MNFYFAFDEYTDVVSGDEVMMIVADVIQAFRDREIPSGNSKIKEMARQWVSDFFLILFIFLMNPVLRASRFFQRTVALVGEDTQGIDHFIADFEAYAKSVIQESDDRVQGIVRDVEEYFILRRDTCGGKPSFSFFGLGLFIPKEVFDHPIMQSLTESATDLIAMTNVSFNFESLITSH